MKGNSVRNVGTVFRSVLTDPVEEGILKVSPAANVRLPTPARLRKDTGIPAETRVLIEGAPEPLRSMAFLMATTGIRRSEIVGLRWSGVDLDSEDAVVVDATVAIAGGRFVFGEITNTASSNRRIALEPRTVAVLRSHRIRQAEQRLAAGEGWCGEVGEIYSPDPAYPIVPA